MVVYGEMKYCGGCEKDLLISKFRYRAKNSKYLESQCIECRRKQFREKRAERRNITDKLVIDYLLEHPCIDCGEKDIVVLDFDHINPKTKSFPISTQMRSGVDIDLLKKEIEKCVVRCANCHRKKTAKDMKYYRWKYQQQEMDREPTK